MNMYQAPLQSTGFSAIMIESSCLEHRRMLRRFSAITQVLFSTQWLYGHVILSQLSFLRSSRLWPSPSRLVPSSPPFSQTLDLYLDGWTHDFSEGLMIEQLGVDRPLTSETEQTRDNPSLQLMAGSDVYQVWEEIRFCLSH